MVWRATRVVIFFNLVCFGWLTFRVNSMSQLWYMVTAIVANFDLSVENLRWQAAACVFYTAILVAVQSVEFRTNTKLEDMRVHPLALGGLYAMCFYAILLYGVHDGQAFIYFQF